MNPLAVSHIADASVTLVPDAIANRDSAVGWAEMLETVATSDQQAEAVRSQRELAGIIKSVEAAREHVKRPVLNLGREIDAKAKEFLAPVIVQERRLGGLVSAYQAEQARIARESEEARQAEIRKAQAEARVKADAEAARIAEEQRIAFAAAEKERDTAKAAELRRQAEERRVEQEKAAAEEAAKPVVVSLPVVAPVAKAPGQVVRTVTRFEVLHAATVYAGRPDLCRIEVLTSAVNRAIAAGERTIPGLRIWEETVSGVRV